MRSAIACSGKPRSGSACRSLMFSVSLLPHSLAALSLPSEVRALCEPDILEASKLSSQLKDIATRIGKPIEHRILLNEVPSILAGFQSHVLSQIEQLGLQRFETLLHYRAAYPEAFLTGLPPHFADRSRPAVAKAVRELDALMAEVFGTVEQQQQKEAA
jgi:chromosome partitioning protein